MSALTHPRNVGPGATLVAPGEALERFFAAHRWPALASDEIALEAACGRVLADDFVSPHAVPSRPHAAVDGYAFRFADLHDGRTLRCSSELRSGKLTFQSVRRGEAVHVCAGGVLPPGSDVVIPLDATVAGYGTVEVVGPTARGANILSVGAEFEAQQVLLRGGCVLTIGDIGLLAAFGMTSVRVRRRPTIALITLGEYLVGPGRLPSPWQTYDVNRYVIGATLSAWGAQVIPLSAKRADNLATTLQMAMRHAEAVVVAEDCDDALEDSRSSVVLAIERMQPAGVIVEGVRMTPGNRSALGVVDARPVIGVSGGSMAAFLALLVLGEPIVRQLVGRGEKAPALPHTARGALRGKRGWDCLVPVRTQSATCLPVVSVEGHPSTIQRANGFVHVPPQIAHYRSGSTVPVELFP